MSEKIIDNYAVDCSAAPLEGSDQWGAYVAIFVPSDNPMHRENIYPKQRVAADLVLSSEDAALAEAERSAEKIVASIGAHITSLQPPHS